MPSAADQAPGAREETHTVTGREGRPPPRSNTNEVSEQKLGKLNISFVISTEKRGQSFEPFVKTL